MYNSCKISFSLPKEDLQMLENARKRMGLSRSAFIDMSVRFWLSWLNKKEMIRRYEEGYKKMPEQIREIKALESAGMEALRPKERWE